jgi:hypothetical protein
MHRAIALWLTERSWRPAVAVAVCGALALQMPLPLMIVAGAIPVLITLRFNAQTGFMIAVTGTVAAGLIVFYAGEMTTAAVLGIAIAFFSPVALALLLKRTGSLNLCFQLVVLGVAALLIAIHAAVPDPIAMWTKFLNELLAPMIAAGLRIEGDKDALIQTWARAMWGVLAALALVIIFGALLLGRWWHSLLESPGAFGSEYQRLRLGLTLGVTITALFVIAIATDSPLVSSLAWVAIVALAFQGLAAAHRSKAGGRLSRGWLAAIYVLLIVPLSTWVTVFVLAVWGFADNWLRPRSLSA